jgi:hypothetical protein
MKPRHGLAFSLPNADLCDDDSPGFVRVCLLTFKKLRPDIAA